MNRDVSNLVAVRELRGPVAPGDPRGAVVSIGVFDGVHRGHQVVLATVVARAHARGLAATVVTFDPPPVRVLAPERAPAQLETIARRLARFGALGVDQVRVIDFDDGAAKETATSFVTRVLVRELGAREIVVGGDFRFGHGREGDVDLLRTLGLEHGFSVHEVPEVHDEERFSSTLARRAVEDGEVIRAQVILGHPLVLDGVVVRGDARGATLGYPTANLTLAEEVVRPGEGVYAGAARVRDGAWYAAAVSIGRRPQFYESGDVLVEAHLLDFVGTLYDQPLVVVLLAYLRAEERFATTQALVAQMDRDVTETRWRYLPFSNDPDSLLGFSLGRRR